MVVMMVLKCDGSETLNGDKIERTSDRHRDE